MATPAQWVEGARLRTLPMAAAPVIAGTAAAQAMHAARPGHAVLALLVALLLQVGVNYANDYSDGVRGTDDERVGPLRLTASGAAAPREVKTAAFVCFGLAALAGVALVLVSQQWWLAVVGILAIAAAWGYTGGKKPYGYMGLGDVFVFVFFGLVATLGTTITQAGRLNAGAWIMAVTTGLFACALLMANNVRDIPGDRTVGKKTLAVRLGDPRARLTFAAELFVAFVLPLLLVPHNPWVLLIYAMSPLAVGAAMTVLQTTERRGLIPVLKQCGFINLGVAVLYAVAVWVYQFVG
ncbi:1,4-dihydroxy-2-naphthoate polyprenyltransferase [Kocuria tytonis]|uniref:1,4-dihydroxy-2-naphthoate octaprenyltransferase n=1 Tax=Kocuria tytonis TaxID=2054280 RepID=A0A495AAG7_9MICC|nr:1,4-dihydroxy-2-naphthoate polyprenyltransferase [Kocuria tytonis]RKQ37029.1 1,4-dihydroxy-2-naphthoate polyprenyltransferase [Kocuria tytonis]